MTSYWILLESGIPVSATTVQHMTFDDKNTDEMKARMTAYDSKLQVIFDSQSADISNSLSGVEAFRVIDAENEDNEFYEEFTRTIDDAAALPHADDQKDLADVQADPYVGMELALSRGDEGEAKKHAIVKRRLIDQSESQLEMPEKILSSIPGDMKSSMMLTATLRSSLRI